MDWLYLKKANLKRKGKEGGIFSHRGLRGKGRAGWEADPDAGLRSSSCPGRRPQPESGMGQPELARSACLPA